LIAVEENNKSPAVLMNGDVLENIFSYLDGIDLMSSRLVCWRWNSSAHSVVNKRWIYKLPVDFWSRLRFSKDLSNVWLKTGSFLNSWKIPYSFINTINPLELRTFWSAFEILEDH
jgi:hypothetical protein